MKAESWCLGSLHGGLYTWSATHNEQTLAAAIDRLSNDIRDPKCFAFGKVKYLEVLRDREINWQLLAWESGIVWHLAGGRYQGSSGTLEEAVDQIFACVRENYGFDPQTEAPAAAKPSIA